MRSKDFVMYDGDVRYHNYSIANKDGKIILNGEDIKYPVKSPKSVTIINNHVFVDGLEYKNGEWKRTLKALRYRLF